MKAYKLAEVMLPCHGGNKSYSDDKKTSQKVKRARIQPESHPDVPVENVFALLKEKEVLEKLAAGWRLKVAYSGELKSNPRDEHESFIKDSTIEGLRTMHNGRMIGVSHRISTGKKYCDIWTLIPPEAQK